MADIIEYAILAGASYYDTRSEVNRFPLPEFWSYFSRIQQSASSGFEAAAFQKTNADGTKEIIISFAGTDPGDLTGDIAADLALAAGRLSDQLVHAAAYYLQVKASAPANATISITGHSLGGGLASLVAAFFGESAFTFDQAPFLNSALICSTTDPKTGVVTTRSVAQDLKATLLAAGVSPDRLGKLDDYIAANNPINPTPIAVDEKRQAIQSRLPNQRSWYTYASETAANDDFIQLRRAIA